MVGDVEPQSLLLPLQDAAPVVLNLRYRGSRRSKLGSVEHAELVGAGAFGTFLGEFDGLGVHLEHGDPGMAGRVEGAAFYEGLDGTLVVRLWTYTLTEVEEILERPGFLSCLYDPLNAVAPNFFYRREAKPDGLPDHREAVPALVDVRRQDLLSHRSGLRHVLRHPIFGVHHAAHEGGHVRLRIVRLEIRCLEGEERVTCAVALVERVTARLLHPVPQLLGDLRSDLVGGAAFDELVFEGGDEPGVLFADGLTQGVGLAGGEAAQGFGDLHELLLVSRNAVGRLQDRLEARVAVPNAPGVMLATLEVRYVVHGTGAVQGVEGH